MNQEDARADDAVSEAYRSLAAERAPQALDQTVLAEARQAVATGTARRWPAFRPLAWAATIALSFTLLLQYTQTGPDIPAVVSEDFAVRQQAAPTPEAAADGNELAELDEAAANGNELAKLDDAAANTPASAPAVKSEAAKRERMQRLDVMSAPAGVADLPEALQESTSTPTGSARADEARVRAVSGVQESEARLEARSPIATSGCDADARADEAAWRQCIEALVAAGRNRLAEKEADEFAEVFPEAEPIDLSD